MTEWRTVQEFDNYEVSSDGAVRRRLDRPGEKGPYSHAGRLLAIRRERGYHRVSLFNGHSLRPRFVHRLVAIAFLGPVPENKQVNHKNGNKSDNRVENLEYVTAKENNAHAIEMGLKTVLKGESHHNAKLTDEQAEKIRSMAGTLTRAELSRRFGVPKTTIARIVTGQGRFSAGVS